MEECVKLTPGVWQQLDQKQYKHVYDIDTFKLDGMRKAFEDFEMSAKLRLAILQAELRADLTEYRLNTKNGKVLRFEEFIGDLKPEGGAIDILDYKEHYWHTAMEPVKVRDQAHLEEMRKKMEFIYTKGVQAKEDSEVSAYRSVNILTGTTGYMQVQKAMLEQLKTPTHDKQTVSGLDASTHQFNWPFSNTGDSI